MDKPFCEAILDSLEEQIAVIDRGGSILFVNESWTRFGMENGASAHYQWVGTNYLDICRAADASGDREAAAAASGIAEVLAGEKKSFYLEYPCHSPDEKRWFILRVTPVNGLDGSYVVSHQNITRRKLAEEAAEHMSLHDPLTGLANRRRHDAFLADEWNRSQRSGECVCLLLIDLDHFKRFNDEMGHLEGDACLKAVAGILRSRATRGSDLSARFGGDEFSVILGATPRKGGEHVAREILESIRRLNLKTGTGETVTVSIGMACRASGRHADCADETALVALADAALYEAKSQGKDCINIK